VFSFARRGYVAGAPLSSHAFDDLNWARSRVPCNAHGARHRHSECRSAVGQNAVVNQESRAKTETVSGPDGFYSIPFLAPAAYEISVESPGFKRYVRDGVRLGANDRVTVDAVLEIGGVNEQVTINAEASALEAATASTGEALESRQVSDLPLSGRAA